MLAGRASASGMIQDILSVNDLQPTTLPAVDLLLSSCADDSMTSIYLVVVTPQLFVIAQASIPVLIAFGIGCYHQEDAQSYQHAICLRLLS